MVTYVRGHFKNVHGTLAFDPGSPALSHVEAVIDTRGLWSGEPKEGGNREYKACLTEAFRCLLDNSTLRSGAHHQAMGGFVSCQRMFMRIRLGQLIVLSCKLGTT